MITLEVLSSIRGHTTMYIDDVSSDKRAELATTITKLIQEGHTVFLIQGDETRRIQSYDAAANEWIVFATVQERKEGVHQPHIKAHRSRATATAPTAGG